MNRNGKAEALFLAARDAKRGCNCFRLQRAWPDI